MSENKRLQALSPLTRRAQPGTQAHEYEHPSLRPWMDNIFEARYLNVDFT